MLKQQVTITTLKAHIKEYKEKLEKAAKGKRVSRYSKQYQLSIVLLLPNLDRRSRIYLNIDFGSYTLIQNHILFTAI